MRIATKAPSQKTIKDVYANIDLYGVDTFLNVLRQYSHVSHCANSVPTPGSNCRPVEALNIDKIKTVSKVIYHRSGKTTIKTNVGFLQFLTL